MKRNQPLLGNTSIRRETSLSNADDTSEALLRENTQLLQKLFASQQSGDSDKTIVYLDLLTTPLGIMLAGATRLGICLLQFLPVRSIEPYLLGVGRQFKTAVVLAGRIRFHGLLQDQLDDYFASTRKDFTFPLDCSGTDFQIKVWESLSSIVYGRTCSYRDLATMIGKPTAFRAVARAIGTNKIAIIVPCHRVIGHDGHLTGYSGGLWRKEFLLNLERKKVIS